MRKVFLFALTLALVLLAVFLADEGAVKHGADLDLQGASPTSSSRTTAERANAGSEARLAGTGRPSDSPTGVPAHGAALRGVVLDPEGEPTSRSVIQLGRWVPRTNSHGVQGMVMDHVGTRWSDASGRFAFPDLEPGAYWTTLLVPPGLLSRRLDFELAPGETREITLAFVRAMVARIDVKTEEGEGIVDAYVALYREAQFLTGAKTDAHGTATLWSVDPEWTCRVEVSPPRSDAENLLRAVKDGWQPGDDTIVLERALRVSGQVVDESGIPVSRAVVQRREGGTAGRWTQSTTATDGTFEYPGLHAGTLTLRAGPPGRAPPADSKEVTVDVVRGDDVILVVPRGKTRTLELQNHVAPLESPIFPRSVLLTPYGRPEDQRTFRVEKDRTVEAMGLEDGVAYVLWGVFEGSPPRYLHAANVVAAPEPLTVGIEKGGTIRCVVRAPEGVYVLGVGLQGPGVVRPSAPLPTVEGVFTIVGVPPGTWRVVAYGNPVGSQNFDPLRVWQAETRASAGDEIELALTLKPYDPR